jgi:hypothetical protein
VDQVSAVSWRPLGELLVADGAIAHDELERALAEQARSGKKLGLILVEQGSLTGAGLAQALARQCGIQVAYEGGFGSGLLKELEQRHRRRRQGEETVETEATWAVEPEASPGPPAEPVDAPEPPHRPSLTVVTSPEPGPPVQRRPLGELLVAGGAITDEELEAALAEQASTGKRLGTILVDRGWITGPGLATALAGQCGVEIGYEGGFGSGLLKELESRHQLRRQAS